MANSDVALYMHPGSFYSQKARLALAEKGVPYKIHMVNILENENLAPWFMKKNRLGMVPLLQHGDKYIADSKTITEYIDNNFDGPALFPQSTAAEAAELITLIDSVNVPVMSFGSFVNQDLTKDSKLPPHVIEKQKEKIQGQLGLATMKKHLSEVKDDPILEAAYKEKIAGYAYSSFPSREALLATLDHTDKVLDKCEKKLADNSKDVSKEGFWLMRKTFTAADIALAVLLFRIRLLGFSDRFLSTRPHLSGYFEKLSKKDSIIKVCIQMKAE